MLDLLQEALQYIEKQNEWIIELKSTVVEREKSYNEIHTKLSTRISRELKNTNTSKQSSFAGTSNVVTSGVSDDTAMKRVDEEIRETDFEITRDKSAFSAEDKNRKSGSYTSYFSSARNKKKKLDAKKSVQPKKEIFNCPICIRSFWSNNSLQLHIRIHSDAGQIYNTCPNCEEKFSVFGDVIQHIRSVHPYHRHRPYDCLFCMETFSTPKEFQSHICTEFDGSYSRKELLEVRKQNDSAKQMNAGDSIQLHHMHAGEKPHSCRHCQNTFQKSIELIQHMHQFHCSDDPYGCSVCKQTFNKESTFKSHRCYSLAETPFTCGFCDKSYTCWKYYALHNDKWHSGIMGYDFAAPSTLFRLYVYWM